MDEIRLRSTENLIMRLQDFHSPWERKVPRFRAWLMIRLYSFSRGFFIDYKYTVQKLGKVK